MNRELQKTVAFVVVAVALTGAAFVSIPDRNTKDAEFNDVGKPFFPDFKDPNACTSLEVIDFDPATATFNPFKVQIKDGKWTIPSHFDYPADGKDRLVRTASAVVDLTKDKIQSDRAEDHEALGVLDPLDTKAGSIKGRGKKVTLKDASDKVLAEFIIGDPVKGHADQRYVRVPGQKRTYGVNVNVDLSTRFADWIETNLLKLDVGKVRKVVFDSNKLDIARRQLIPGDVLTIERKDAATPWTLVGAEIPTGKELDTEKLFALATALGDVKIAGVRPKPEGLSSELKAIGDLKELTGRAAWTSLIAMGFYPVKDRVVSNQGDIIISTEEGAVYTLRFGEATFASGESLSKGGDEPKAEQGKEKKDDKKPGATESRYLLVTVGFDPKLLPPLPDPDAGKPLELPADVFHHEPGSPERVAEDKVAKEKADKRKAEEDKRVAEAEAKVRELTDRFAGWYYLTPNEAFKSLALNKDNLFREKGAKPAPGPGMPGAPGGFPGGFPGFPPGGPGGGRPMNPHGPG